MTPRFGTPPTQCVPVPRSMAPPGCCFLQPVVAGQASPLGFGVTVGIVAWKFTQPHTEVSVDIRGNGSVVRRQGGGIF